MSIHDLAFKGVAMPLRAVLSCQPSRVNELSVDRGSSLLYTAARFGHMDVCNMLITEFHADVNIQNKDNLSTPLHGAAFGGHADIVSLLKLHGANQDAKNAYHETPRDNALSPAEGVKKAASTKTLVALGTTACKATPPVPVPVQPLVSLPLPAAPPASTDVDISSALQLAGLTVAELRNLCQTRGLNTTGVKTILIDRVVASTKPAAPAAPTADEPPLKKMIVEAVASAAPTAIPAPVAAAAPQPVAPPSAAITTTATTISVRSVEDPSWIAKLSAATYTETEVVQNTQEFWDLEEKVNAWYQGRNEDYVSNRLKKKKKPLTFVLKRAWKIHNPALEEAFAETRKAMQGVLEESQCRVRVAFHGTREVNIPSILKTGLLRFKHPLNPCKTQADDGYFGTNLKGVYVSRYYDYTLKYCNGLTPLDDGALAKTIMFKCLPGKVFQIPKLSMGIQPTPGHNSHGSPNNLEWYLFDESQACPEYVLELRAQEDTRTAADDE